MLKRNSINVHLPTTQPGPEVWCLSKVRTRPAGRIGDFGNFFMVFTKSPYLLPYMWHGAYFSDWTLAALCWILFMKTFYNVISSIVCCAKEARAWIVLDWLNECNLSCKIVKNCRLIVLNRAKKVLSEVCMIKRQCLIVPFTLYVMYKKYISPAVLHVTRFVTKIYLSFYQK